MASNLAAIALRSAGRNLLYSATSRRNVPRSMSQGGPLAHRQDQMQIADETPVHIKGGTIDSILYRFTAGCCLFSICLMAYNYYKLVNKK